MSTPFDADDYERLEKLRPRDNHTPSLANDDTQAAPYMQQYVTCTCGWTYGWGRFAAPQTAWVNHIEMANGPQDAVYLGKLIQLRQEKEFYAFPSTNQALFTEFVEKASIQTYRTTTLAGSHGPRGSYFVVGWKSVSNKTKSEKRGVYGTASTLPMAIEVARKFLISRERNGTTFELADGVHRELKPLVVSSQSSLLIIIETIDSALASKRSSLIETVLEELDRYLSFVPVLTEKRAQLAEHREHLLTRKLLA